MNIKKFTAGIIAAAMIFGMAYSDIPTVPENPNVIIASAYEITDDGFEYLSYGSYIEIKSYGGSAEKLDIPTEINGVPVTMIGFSAFDGNENLTEVTIPETVTRINMYAFRDCKKLKKINIPNGVTKIESNSFKGCDSLAKIIIPDSVEIIDDWAFQDCTMLNNVVIPDGVTGIGAMAFYGCSALSDITFPDSLTYIGMHAFNDTPWLKNQPDGEIAYAGKVAYEYIGNTYTVKSIEIKEGTVALAEVALFGCSALEELSLPDSIIAIHSLAISECTNLKNIKLPANLKDIGSSAFSCCTSLEEIVIPEGVESIGVNAFNCCTKLKSVTAPDSLIYVQEDALLDTQWYDDQPDGVVYLGNVAFDYKGEFPENASITLKDGTTSLMSKTFYKKKLKEIKFPESISFIGYKAVGFSESVADQDDLTIYGYRETIAEEYALGYEFTFVPLGAEPNETEVTGDIDGDGEVTAQDALKILQAIVGMAEFDENEKKFADVDGDGEITAKDALAVLQIVVKYSAE